MVVHERPEIVHRHDELGNSKKCFIKLSSERTQDHLKMARFFVHIFLREIHLYSTSDSYSVAFLRLFIQSDRDNVINVSSKEFARAAPL